jgi:hypothetical protein
MHVSAAVLTKSIVCLLALSAAAGRLRKMGLQPVTRDAAPAGKQYPYVLFAAPPSGSEDYPAAVSSSAQTAAGAAPHHATAGCSTRPVHASQQCLSTCGSRMSSSTTVASSMLQVFFCGLPGEAESYRLATHDSDGRTQLPGAPCKPPFTSMLRKSSRPCLSMRTSCMCNACVPNVPPCRCVRPRSSGTAVAALCSPAA